MNSRVSEPPLMPVAHQLRKSPNFDDRVIPVEFVVIHYTACSLERALDILCNTERKASSHLVIDEDGEIYELVDCLDTSRSPKRAWHAGVSRLELDGKKWESFNDFSIGIEIVNFNGNVFSFSGAQYEALEHVLEYLISRFPVLADPRRIVGHEEIAGFRGKVDPGHSFDWARVHMKCHPGATVIQHIHALPEGCQRPLELLVEKAPEDESKKQEFFTALSGLCESLVGEMSKK